jgi:preprotein translocase subunit SecD
MEQTVSVIGERVDPTGTLDALVSRHGKYGIIIELPYLPPADLIAARERISSLGKLEMRVVATDDYLDAKDNNKKVFNLAQEKQRLEAWLKGGGKALLKDDWKAIDNYNNDVENGPLAKGNLRWFVHFLEPDMKAASRWNYSFSQADADLTAATVKVFEDAEFNGGSIPEAFKSLPKEKQKLIELVAINMNEVHFSGEDLEASGVRADMSQEGTPCVDYMIVGGKAIDYANWSEKYIKKHSAIILNNVIKSAPVFISRIPGNGQITGSFTQAEAEDLAQVLKSRPLPVVPVLVRQEPATKGGPASRGR